MNETLGLILKRRSIRSFTNLAIDDDQLDLLLQAAMAAPSARDQRPWAFVVVRDFERKNALADVHQWSYMCANAPAVIAVLGDQETSTHWIEDCSAATENLLLAAAGLDLGTVWVAIYPHTERENTVRQILNIPERFRVLCLIPIGKPAETKPPRTRYEKNKIYAEVFGAVWKDEN